MKQATIKILFGFSRPKAVPKMDKIKNNGIKEQEKMKKMEELNQYIDPKTSEALDKYIDSLNTNSFEGMVSKLYKDVSSEHGRFKEIIEQTKKNKQIEKLFKDNKSELFKIVSQFTGDFTNDKKQKK